MGRAVAGGAGSGKTRVLVDRIAWWIFEGLSPWGFCCHLYQQGACEIEHGHRTCWGSPSVACGVWPGTSPACVCIGRRPGLPQGFQIMDSDDQQRLVKRIIRTMNLDDSKWPPRQAQWFINKQKDEGLRADHLDHGGDPYQRQMIAIDREYQAACQRAGSVDFAELLLRAHG